MNKMPEPSENSVILSDLNNIVSNFPFWDFFYNQKVLVTGGNGLIASYLVRSLLYANYILSLNLQVTCLIRSRNSDLFRLNPWIEDPSLHLVYGEVESYPLQSLQEQSIIVHAASGASPKLYKTDPIGIILPNTVGTSILCKQASKWRSKRFLFFSTGEVYGINHNPFFSEEDYGFINPTESRSCYAESKRCGESICVAYSNQLDLHATIARIFHTYGPQMKLDDGRVFADFIRDSLKGDQITLTSRGESLRCFCYLADATIGFLYLIVKGSPANAFNLANPAAEISIRDLALLISNLSDPPLRVVFDSTKLSQSNYLPSQVPRSLPSINKINSIGWSPTTSLQDGFSRTRSSYLF